MNPSRVGQGVVLGIVFSIIHDHANFRLLLLLVYITSSVLREQKLRNGSKTTVVILLAMRSFPMLAQTVSEADAVHILLRRNSCLHP